ncbi:hypothetical protein CU097_008536 [Rhizopus azygosporus]|uniref:Uncharacterized protein n=1 Tax=Rhizopus azygosporus TaxID=86630 RepID=A0A367J925_RHIAZ|nr:hypothetical protein CU097_008536 [Rhizopus azygosporus]
MIEFVIKHCEGDNTVRHVYKSTHAYQDPLFLFLNIPNLFIEMVLQGHDSAESIHEERHSYDHLEAEEEAPMLMDIIPRESAFIRGANVTCQIIFLTLCLAG